jgi:hypothetical protein
MRLRNLILIILCAFFAFGGTFTCSSGGDDHVVTDPSPHSPSK